MGEFNEAKFKNLILYIAKRSEGDPRFGAVKLNKILYYSDFNAYRTLGDPITHATYQKLHEGPGTRELIPIRRQMLDASSIEIEHRTYFTGVQQRIVAKDTPNLDVFSPRELEIVNEVIDFFWNMSAREVSAFSHEELGWELATKGETIPYQTAWVSSEPIPQEPQEMGLELVEQFG